LPQFLTSLFEDIFSSIHSMDLGAKTSLIIYLQPWSESMALAPFDFMDFTRFSRNLVLRVHPKSEGKSLHLGKTSFGNLFLVLR
jgi:hypothetical protein